MSIVIPIGYFREFRHGMENGPSIHEATQRGNYGGEKSLLVSYLKAGTIYVASPGIGTDVLDEEPHVSGPIHSLTDGRWMWPADLSYYVEKYNVALPIEFLMDLRRHNWTHPKPEDIDLSSLTPDI